MTTQVLFVKILVTIRVLRSFIDVFTSQKSCLACAQRVIPYYCINTRVTGYQQPFINEERVMRSYCNSRAHVLLNMAFTHARYRAPRKARASNEKLKSARNGHKKESVYAYENVMRL